MLRSCTFVYFFLRNSSILHLLNSLESFSWLWIGERIWVLQFMNFNESYFKSVFSNFEIWFPRPFQLDFILSAASELPQIITCSPIVMSLIGFLPHWVSAVLTISLNLRISSEFSGLRAIENPDATESSKQTNIPSKRSGRFPLNCEQPKMFNF